MRFLRLSVNKNVNLPSAQTDVFPVYYICISKNITPYVKSTFVKETKQRAERKKQYVLYIDLTWDQVPHIAWLTCPCHYSIGDAEYAGYQTSAAYNKHDITI